MNQAGYPQLFIYEMVATFIFTYGFTCYNHKYEIDAQAAGSMLLAFCISGSLSAANINPIVTLSNILKKENKYKASKVWIYLFSQTAGAILGLFLA
jgi:hypothetical protein